MNKCSDVWILIDDECSKVISEMMWPRSKVEDAGRDRKDYTVPAGIAVVGLRPNGDWCLAWGGEGEPTTLDDWHRTVTELWPEFALWLIARETSRRLASQRTFASSRVDEKVERIGLVSSFIAAGSK